MKKYPLDKYNLEKRKQSKAVIEKNKKLGCVQNRMEVCRIGDISCRRAQQRVLQLRN